MSGGAVGGLSNVAMGGDFWEGFAQGGITAGLSFAMNRIAAEMHKGEVTAGPPDETKPSNKDDKVSPENMPRPKDAEKAAHDPALNAKRQEVLEAQAKEGKERIYAIVRKDGKLEAWIKKVELTDTKTSSKSYVDYFREVIRKISTLRNGGAKVELIEYGHTHPTFDQYGVRMSQSWEGPDSSSIRDVFHIALAVGEPMYQTVLSNGGVFIVQAKGTYANFDVMGHLYNTN